MTNQKYIRHLIETAVFRCQNSPD